MKGTRIKSMTPLTNDHGDVIRAITTENNDTGMTIQRFYNKVRVREHVLYVPRETAPIATVIRKPLFEVVDDDGNVFRLTKRRAKKMFSARQVRNALKRMRSELKHNLREERRRILEARRPEEKPEFFDMEKMAERMGIDLSDLEGYEPENEDDESTTPEGEEVAETDLEDTEDVLAEDIEEK